LDLPGIHLVDISLFNRILYPMKNQVRAAFTIFAILVVVTGMLYPLLMTGLAQGVFPFQANGSLLKKGSDHVGSRLIGQDFTDPKYFWGRPSAVTDSSIGSSGAISLVRSSASNLGPLSQSLVDAIRKRVADLKATDPGNSSSIPVDLVTASASGLDPHISILAARYQVPRIARLRGLSEASVSALIDRNTEGRWLGLLGEPRVNVLLLNLALDAIQ
jgi:K+-transporting ATPase ATPase C chain